MLEESISVWTHHERNKTPLNAVHATLVLKLNQILPLFHYPLFHLLNLNQVTIFTHSISVLGSSESFEGHAGLFEGILWAAERCWRTCFHWGVNCVNPQMALMFVISFHLFFFSVSLPSSNTQPLSRLSSSLSFLNLK